MSQKFIINDEEVEESEFWYEFEKAIGEYVDDNLDDLIDEENEEVKIGSLSYSPSQVLKNTDPVAYRCYSGDMRNYFYEDNRYELERGHLVSIGMSDFQIEEE